MKRDKQLGLICSLCLVAALAFSVAALAAAPATPLTPIKGANPAPAETTATVAVPKLQPGGEVKLEDPSLGVEGYITIYAPSDYTPDRTWPAVFCYHGVNNPPTTWPFRQVTGGKGFVVIGMPFYSKDLAAYDTVSKDIANLKRYAPVLVKQLNLDPRQLFIGGFSMGGFLSDHIGTSTAGIWAGLAIMGAGRNGGGPAKGFAGKPVYIAAGEKDGNLEAAKRAVESYKAAGADVTFETYAGMGHAVKQDSKILADWLWNSGPLKQAKIDMDEAKAAQTAGKLGQAYAKFKQVAAIPGGSDLAVEAGKTAAAIGKDADALLKAAETAVTEKRYGEAATQFTALAAKFDGCPFGERAQKGLADMKNDPAIQATIGQATINAEAKVLMDQAQAFDTAKDYAKAIARYEQIIKGFEKADCFAAAKARLEALKNDKTIQADLRNKEAERDCRSWMSMVDNFMKAENPDKAREYLQKIIDKYPDTEWGAEAKKRLAAMK
jgi:dienelactone hydrolase/outer membrane protein assembly factor BamD (BamD/ComL family)